MLLHKGFRLRAMPRPRDEIYQCEVNNWCVLCYKIYFHNFIPIRYQWYVHNYSAIITTKSTSIFKVCNGHGFEYCTCQFDICNHKIDKYSRVNPLGTGDLKFYQSQELSTFWGLPIFFY